jgi:hypothetical protein
VTTYTYRKHREYVRAQFKIGDSEGRAAVKECQQYLAEKEAEGHYVSKKAKKWLERRAK